MSEVKITYVSGATSVSSRSTRFSTGVMAWPRVVGSSPPGHGQWGALVAIMTKYGRSPAAAIVRRARSSAGLPGIAGKAGWLAVDAEPTLLDRRSPRCPVVPTRRDVVRIQAAPSVTEQVAAHEAGLVAGVVKPGGDRRGLDSQVEGAGHPAIRWLVAIDAMAVGVLAAHDRGLRRAAQGRGDEHSPEAATVRQAGAGRSGCRTARRPGRQPRSG